MIRSIALVLALVLALAGCSDDTTTDPGDGAVAAVGEELFKRTVLADNAGCVTCHSLTAGRVLIGPSLADIGAVAADRITGMAARAYLEQSIVDPDAYVVAGFNPGLMPDDWVEGLSPAEVAALVDYMLTLGAG